LKNSQNKIEIVVEQGDSPPIISLLENTVFGTHGKTRYRQKEIAKGIASQKQIEFIQIKKGERVLGTTGVIKRDCGTGDHTLKSLYIRYLSMWNPFRNGTKRKPNQRLGKTTSTLRKRLAEKIIEHFEQPVQEREEQAAFYAFVESDNLNSKELCISLGFDPYRTVSTLLFSRFFPKKHDSVEKSGADLHQEIKERLTSFYENHSFYFEDRIFSKGRCFVFKKDNQIVAGLRAIPVNWEIVEVPGIKGVLMQKVLPHLPLTSRIFEPENLRFLTFDYFWSEPGYETTLPILMEHAQADFGIHTGMFWCDNGSDSYRFFTKSGKLGFLHKVNGPVQAKVMMRFINMNENSRRQLLSKPVFVSAMDMS
jgi:hypothetical protein